MPDTSLSSLQIPSDAGELALSAPQSRFNALVQDVATWRAALANWKERFDRLHQTVEPLRREFHAAWRAWVLALENASHHPELTRGERARLVELMREAASALLQVDEDEAIAELAGRQGDDEVSPQPVPPETLVEAHEEDLQHLAEDWERQAAAAAAQRDEWAAKRRAAATLKRSKQAKQEVSHSLRDVYRRLASAVHPDREADAEVRAHKTALMQQANEAYAQGNLLALLELQLQAEELDAAHLVAVDQRRLAHFIAILQEQLADLQSEVRRLEADFRAAVGAPPGHGLQPRKAERMISAEAQALRADLVVLRRQVQWLTDVETTREWLREQRRG
ncbi:MAG: DnaJ protein [Ramlibacter sp.]|nr:DnaJ protein [Ramlibacter sp.]